MKQDKPKLESLGPFSYGEWVIIFVVAVILRIYIYDNLDYLFASCGAGVLLGVLKGLADFK